MHIHILGICGKFMSGLAVIAKQKGFTVSGSDKVLLKSMVEMLQDYEIDIQEGYEADSVPAHTDCVIIGNALSRGFPVIETILNENIRYMSGPQWLHDYVLQDKWVIAVSGTHGKTTTTGMIMWMLEEAGYDPGFLIGGNPLNFTASARYTSSNFFVIEADEYDTAFFDKRSKFLHYHPRTLIINNLEFDHADIFKDLEDIKRQFKHLLRIVPSHGLIIVPAKDHNVQSLLKDHDWTPHETFNHERANWFTKKRKADGSEFEVYLDRELQGCVRWELLGEHNMQNALAAISAARHVGIPPSQAITSLNTFKSVKRRLELRGVVRDIKVYDDFAHHPTAITTTISALRRRVGQERIFAVLEFASNTMRAGHHETTLPSAFLEADSVVLLRPQTTAWNVDNIIHDFEKPVTILDSVAEIVCFLNRNCRPGDHVLCMSNVAFDGIHEKLLEALAIPVTIEDLHG